jgi:hypothetical protein
MKHKSLFAICLLLLGGLSACGGGGGDDLDLNGSWRLQATLSSNTCGLPNVALAAVDVTVAQSGSRITISGNGLSASGTLDGNDLSIDNGTLTVTGNGGCQVNIAFSLSGRAGETSISGTFTGQFVLNAATCGVNLNCNGTASYTMTKL